MKTIRQNIKVSTYRICVYRPFSLDILIDDNRKEILDIINKKREEHINKYGEVTLEKQWTETQSETTWYECGYFIS